MSEKFGDEMRRMSHREFEEKYLGGDTRKSIDDLAQLIAERLYIKYGYHSIPLMKPVIAETLTEYEQNIRNNDADQDRQRLNET